MPAWVWIAHNTNIFQKARTIKKQDNLDDQTKQKRNNVSNDRNEAGKTQKGMPK